MRQFIAYLTQFAHFSRNARWYLLRTVLIGIVYGIILVLYSLYLSAIGYDTDLIGLLLFFTPLGISLAIIPAGFLLDRVGSKTLLTWSSVVMVIAVIGQVLFRTLVPLSISAFVLGIGLAFDVVIGAPFLTANSTPEERVHLFSFNAVLLLVSNVLGEVFGGAFPPWLRTHPWAMFPSLSWPLASEPLVRSYQIDLLIGILLASTSFIPLFLMTNEPPSQARSEQRRFLFRKGRADLKTPDATDSASRPRPRLSLPGPQASMAGAFALISLGTGTIFPYISLFFVKHLGASSALFGIIDGSTRIITAAATLLAPWLTMRMGRLRTIVLTSLLAVPVILTIGIFPLLLLAALLYPLSRALWNMSDGVLSVLGMEIVPPERRGRASSSYQIAGQIALAVAAPIGGILLKYLGYTSIFSMTAVFFLLATVLVWWRFGGKRFVTPTSPDAAEMGPQEEEQATALTDSLVTTEDGVTDTTSSDAAEMSSQEEEQVTTLTDGLVTSEDSVTDTTSPDAAEMSPQEDEQATALADGLVISEDGVTDTTSSDDAEMSPQEDEQATALTDGLVISEDSVTDTTSSDAAEMSPQEDEQATALADSLVTSEDSVTDTK